MVKLAVGFKPKAERVAQEIEKDITPALRDGLEIVVSSPKGRLTKVQIRRILRERNGGGGGSDIMP